MKLGASDVVGPLGGIWWESVSSSRAADAASHPISRLGWPGEFAAKAHQSKMTETTGEYSMRRSHPKGLGQRIDRARRGWIAAASVALVLVLASPVAADEYDASNAGHPLRLIAYVLHPVGVLIDYVLLRPAHWLVSSEPLKTIFGHED